METARERERYVVGVEVHGVVGLGGLEGLPGVGRLVRGHLRQVLLALQPELVELQE